MGHALTLITTLLLLAMILGITTLLHIASAVGLWSPAAAAPEAGER